MELTRKTRISPCSETLHCRQVSYHTMVVRCYVCVLSQGTHNNADVYSEPILFLRDMQCFYGLYVYSCMYI